MAVLHLESSENKLLTLDFSISEKTCFYGQTLLGRSFFYTVIKYFFEILAPFHISKNFLKYQILFSNKIRHESTTLNVTTTFFNICHSVLIVFILTISFSSRTYNMFNFVHDQNLRGRRQRW